MLHFVVCLKNKFLKLLQHFGNSVNRPAHCELEGKVQKLFTWRFFVEHGKLGNRRKLFVALENLKEALSLKLANEEAMKRQKSLGNKGVDGKVAAQTIADTEKVQCSNESCENSNQNTQYLYFYFKTIVLLLTQFLSPLSCFYPWLKFASICGNPTLKWKHYAWTKIWTHHLLFSIVINYERKIMLWVCRRFYPVICQFCVNKTTFQSFFFETFLWARKMQFWQPCRHFFAQSPIKIIHSWIFSTFSQNVPLDTYNAVLTTLMKIFCSNSEKIYNLIFFSVRKLFAQNVPPDIIYQFWEHQQKTFRSKSK